MNFWGSYKVVDSKSCNFYSLGFWASEIKNNQCWDSLYMSLEDWGYWVSNCWASTVSPQVVGFRVLI